MQKKKTEYKFDIFSLLDKVNKKNITYLNSLTKEDKKHISPYMVMRWMSGSGSAKQIIYLNELVNRIIWNIPKDYEGEEHFNLQMFLLSICGTNKSGRFTWISTKLDKKKPIALEVLKRYFNYNTRDAKDAIDVLTPEDIISYAEQLGYQTEDLKKLKKELG